MSDVNLNRIPSSVIQGYGQGVDPAVSTDPKSRLARKTDSGTTSAATELPADSTTSSDEVRLTARPANVERARRAVAESSGVREDRIAKLREQVQNGTYQVDVEKLARRLMALHPRVTKP